MMDMKDNKELAKRIPRDPAAAYWGKGWRGWNDFLGIDPNTPEGRENIERDKRDEARLGKPFYAEALTPEDAMEMLLNMGGVFEVLYEDSADRCPAGQERAKQRP